MKNAFLVLCLLVTVPSLRAQVCYHIIDEEGGVPSACLFVNGAFASVTDGEGKAFISGMNKGDTLRISHLAYAPFEYVLSSEPRDTTITLSPLYFDLEAAAYVKEFDYDILQEKLRDGLRFGHYMGKVPMVSRDTLSIEDRRLYIEEKGTVSFPAVGFKVLKHHAVVTGAVNSDKSSLSKDEISNMKGMLVSKISNAGAFAEDICKCRKSHGLRVEYRGQEDGRDIFYFFVPPQDYVGRSKGSKYRGLAYINSATGVLEYITASFVASGDGYESYEVKVRYHYLAESNSILPEVILHTSFIMNVDGTPRQTLHNHIELDWAAAL